MKANELRIGNYVAIKDFVSIQTVYGLQEDVIYLLPNKPYQHTKDIIPIPLTEEWLLSFGFMHGQVHFIGDTGWKKSGNNFCIELTDKGEYFSFHSPQFNLQVTSVNQLQNLYFALTGEELIIGKPPEN